MRSHAVVATVVMGVAMFACSSCSGTKGTSPALTPAAPSSLSASRISGTQINLSWQDNSDDESGFELIRLSGDTGSFVALATVGVDTTTYRDTDVVASLSYSYKVRAFSAKGSSAWSDSAIAPTVPLTDGEQIRLLLETGADETILFSSAILSDQTGTIAYSRTIDSVRRGFVNYRFYDDNVELASPVLAFEARILDTLFGRVSYHVGAVVESYPYTLLAYGGNAKFLKIGSISTHPSAWYIWRMEYRHAEQSAGDGSPAIQTMTISAGGVTKSIATPTNVRLYRDSVLTMQIAMLTNVAVSVLVDTPNDSFFVTYPLAGGYETAVMTHDSLTHTATVQVSSSNRFELLTVQGFKREAFTDTMYVESIACAIRAAIVAFR